MAKPKLGCKGLSSLARPTPDAPCIAPVIRASCRACQPAYRPSYESVVVGRRLGRTVHRLPTHGREGRFGSRLSAVWDSLHRGLSLSRLLARPAKETGTRKREARVDPLFASYGIPVTHFAASVSPATCEKAASPWAKVVQSPVGTHVRKSEPLDPHFRKGLFATICVRSRPPPYGVGMSFGVLDASALLCALPRQANGVCRGSPA